MDTIAIVLTVLVGAVGYRRPGPAIRFLKRRFFWQLCFLGHNHPRAEKEEQTARAWAWASLART